MGNVSAILFHSEMISRGFKGSVKLGFRSRFIRVKFTKTHWVASSDAGVLITSGALSNLSEMFSFLDSRRMIPAIA
ncbi:hypothetical protein D3C71_1302310 [compost metagenome]